jgi:hypothetical protein
MTASADAIPAADVTYVADPTENQMGVCATRAVTTSAVWRGTTAVGKRA